MVRFPPATTMDNRTAASQTLPAYLEPIVDGVTGCSVVRISDETEFETAELILRHAYSKVQPWNADGSKLVLNFTSPHAVLDGNSYAVLSADASLPGSFRWSNVNPDLAYGCVSNNQFVSVDMSANDGTDRTTLHTFTGHTELTIGDGEGNLSNDDTLVVFISTPDGGTNYTFTLYNIATDTVVDTLTGLDHYDWATISPLGQYIVVNWGQEGSSAEQGIDVYDLEFTFLRHLTDKVEHADIGRDAHGNEVLVTISGTGVANAGLAAIRLDGGGTTILIANPPDYYGGHVSCRNTLRPGWAYISSYGNDTDMPGIDEVQAIKLDGSGAVESFAMEHHTQPANDDDYQAHAVPNRDGSRVLFASDWEAGFTSTPSYAYVAEYAREDAVGPLGPF